MTDVVLDDFARHLNEPFDFVGEGGSEPFPLVLREAQPLKPSVRPGGSFSLTFAGPLAPILPQGMYDVRRGDETWSLFMVPLGPKGEVAHYEVIFN